MRLLKPISFLIISVLFCFSCAENKKEKAIEQPLEKVIAAIKTNFAPDKRVVLFDVNVTKKDKIKV